jgi:hypothetical protein
MALWNLVEDQPEPKYETPGDKVAHAIRIGEPYESVLHAKCADAGVEMVFLNEELSQRFVCHVCNDVGFLVPAEIP